MELVPFRQEHANTISQWFLTKEEFLAWGGRVFIWPLTAEAICQRSCETTLSFFVLIDNREVVGFIELNRISDDETRLCRIAVNPDARGQGIGKELVRFAIREIQQNHSAKHITLAVFHSNKSAKRCYESVGFKVVDKPPYYKTFDGVKWPIFQMVFDV